MMEQRILSAILTSRSNYETVIKALDGESFADSFSPIAKGAAKILEEYYTLDPAAQTCSREVLLDRAAKVSNNPHLAKALEDFCKRLEEGERVSVPNLVRDIRDHRRYRVGDKIAGLLANRTESKELDDLISKYQSLRSDSDAGSSKASEIFHAVPVSELFTSKRSGESVPFGLEVLNRYTDGGVRMGHHMLIVGRPEIGKSLLAIELVCGWLEQGHRVMYIENEEPLVDTTIRVVGRLCKRPRGDIRQHPEKAQEAATKRGYENYVGISCSPGNFREIGALVDKYDPRFVVINQLRNIDVGDDNRVTALEKAAIGGRNLAKRGRTVLSVTQAGDSAEGKRFLGMSDIDFSKTGIPGAIDLGIGIGATDEDKRFNVRGISLFKNKLGTLEDNHGCFTVRVSPSTGVIEEISN